MRTHGLAKLIQTAASKRDGDAFAQLVRRLKGVVLGIALSRVRDWHLAQDVTQETFVEAYLQLPKLRVPAAFVAWLRRIAIKHCDRALRRRPVQPANLDVAAVDGDPANAAQRQEIRVLTLEALRKLPQAERDVLAMYYLQGQRLSDVARFLGTNTVVVKQRLHRARRKLKERLLVMAQDTFDSADRSLEQRVAQAIRVLAAKGPDRDLVDSAWDRKWKRQMKTIVKGGALGMQITKRLATHPQAKLRRAAALQLGLRHDHKHLDALRQMMGDPSPRVREMAVAQYAATIHPVGNADFFSFGQPADRIAGDIAPLVNALADAHLRVKLRAITALGAYAHLGDARITTALRSAMGDATHKVVHAAAALLNEKCPGCGNVPRNHSRRVE